MRIVHVNFISAISRVNLAVRNCVWVTLLVVDYYTTTNEQKRVFSSEESRIPHLCCGLEVWIIRRLVIRDVCCGWVVEDDYIAE